jgi:succinate dehydrogenase/fumarate reductase iron-sulfur protein
MRDARQRRGKIDLHPTIRSVTHNGGTLRVEPLRNFPVVSDLVVDMSDLYLRLDQAQFSQVADLDDAGLGYEKIPAAEKNYERLVDCIECGCCISACPIALTTPEYMGPAVLAAIQESYVQTGSSALLDLADQASAAWRCHSAYGCTAVCPSNVDPGWRIMNLRRHVVGSRIKRLFKG